MFLNFRQHFNSKNPTTLQSSINKMAKSRYPRSNHNNYDNSSEEDPRQVIGFSGEINGCYHDVGEPDDGNGEDWLAPNNYRYGRMPQPNFCHDDSDSVEDDWDEEDRDGSDWDGDDWDKDDFSDSDGNDGNSGYCYGYYDCRWTDQDDYYGSDDDEYC